MSEAKEPRVIDLGNSPAGIAEILKKVISPEPVAEGHCLRCKDPFTEANVYTAAGWRETKISGFCERCFNEMFAEEDETEEVEPDVAKILADEEKGLISKATAQELLQAFYRMDS